MSSIAEEFQYRASALDNADFREITGRLIALVQWMEAQPPIKVVLDNLQEVLEKNKPFEGAGPNRPPKANSPEEIAAVGYDLIRACEIPQQDFHSVLFSIGTRDYGSNNISDHVRIGLARYIEPFLKFVMRSLPDEPATGPVVSAGIPPTLTESLAAFRSDYPDPRKVCFIMMRFGKTDAHEEVTRAIKEAMSPLGISALRADDKEFSDEVFSNIQTYIYGSAFGVAVFERIESEDFNPNVSLELGIMYGLRKPVLLLKDQTMKTLTTDLLGKLYRPFDPQSPGSTIPPQVRQWLEDKNLA